MSFKELQTNQSYTHSGEIFSRFQFLKASSQKQNILHIVSGENISKKYTLIADEFQASYRFLSSYHDLIQLENGTGGIYTIEIDSLENNISLQEIENPLKISIGEEYVMDDMLKLLTEKKYEFSDYDKAGTFQRSGDIISLYTPDAEHIQLSFWGDEIENITKNGEKVDCIIIASLDSLETNEKKHISLGNYLGEKGIFSILDNLEFHHNYEGIHNIIPHISSFDILPNNQNNKKHIDLRIETLHISTIEDLREKLGKKTYDCNIFTRHNNVVRNFLDNNNFSHISSQSVKTHLLTSFSLEKIKGRTSLYICDDILGKIFIKKRVKKKLSADIDLLLKIQNGDFVVHIDHGIGVFKGIVKKDLGNVSKEYMEISYEKEDKLFVPITEVHRVSKYVGSENPKLTPLSGKVWERKMKKVHEDIREVAEGILQSFAERKLRESERNLFFKEKIDAFQGEFPYPYTQDQENTIGEIFTDMQSAKNMDRLVVGDVGFGKTEIAFNAAYMALSNKKQVLFISPLVVLAHEHYNKAIERFLEFGVNIEVLTRLQSQKHATRVLKGLKDGTVDMVIGTHRLLSDKIVCKNLGLMIVDEEHKFGVVDKEKIKKLRSDIDILSLSATPIPRSLNLALSGVRDISLLKTPPSGRKSIETSVIKFNEQVIIDAGKREFARGGQIFFVHNRVTNIEAVKKQLEGLFPGKKVIITHGQLEGEELENRIIDFKNKKYDILLSTTVIENGIDFSNVNTIFINECQSFGISQIHQLRGRVGRSQTQGYCYLLYRKEQLDGEAAKRIQTIVDYSYLGAGFELAMKDLEIRGGGDILGVRQSGQSKEIGVSLFLKMLEEKIEELKQEQSEQEDKNSNKPKKIQVKTSIDLMLTAGIPDSYFLNETDKLNFYREIELVENLEDLSYVKNSFFENSSEEIPQEAENLFLLLEAQIRASGYKILHIKKLGINYQIDFHESNTLQELKDFLSLDKEVKFHVVDIHRIRCSTKVFENDRLFIEYLLQLMQGNVGNKKVKLVKKAIK